LEVSRLNEARTFQRHIQHFKEQLRLTQLEAAQHVNGYHQPQLVTDYEVPLLLDAPTKSATKLKRRTDVAATKQEDNDIVAPMDALQQFAQAAIAVSGPAPLQPMNNRRPIGSRPPSSIQSQQQLTATSDTANSGPSLSTTKQPTRTTTTHTTTTSVDHAMALADQLLQSAPPTNIAGESATLPPPPRTPSMQHSPSSSPSTTGPLATNDYKRNQPISSATSSSSSTTTLPSSSSSSIGVTRAFPPTSSMTPNNSRVTPSTTDWSWPWPSTTATATSRHHNDNNDDNVIRNTPTIVMKQTSGGHVDVKPLFSIAPATDYRPTSVIPPSDINVTSGHTDPQRRRSQQQPPQPPTTMMASSSASRGLRYDFDNNNNEHDDWFRSTGDVSPIEASRPPLASSYPPLTPTMTTTNRVMSSSTTIHAASASTRQVPESSPRRAFAAELDRLAAWEAT
jgi:hypothetical protein